MVTREEFEAYQKVREGGKTNMFHTANVMRLALYDFGVKLTKSVCIEIMYNFAALEEKFRQEAGVCDVCRGSGEYDEGEFDDIRTVRCYKCNPKVSVEEQMDDNS